PAPSADDSVISFQTVASAISGRLVRLGPAVDDILNRHDYPEPVSKILAQALALTAMLGSQLKFDGKLILQTKSDGPLGFIVVNYQTAGTIRGYASFNAERLQALTDAGAATEAAILGNGHLAMTIDPGGDMERYQGIVALDNCTLAQAALEYFRQSEQLPTFIRLSVARHFSANPSTGGGVWRWRTGGLMVQHLTAQGGHEKPEPEDDPSWVDEPDRSRSEPFASNEDVNQSRTKKPGTRATGEFALSDDERVLGNDDENWRRVEILASTVEDHELLDPTLTPERLLYRLFHEEGVAVSAQQPIAMRCGCSRDAVENFLKSFGKAQLSDMRDLDGAVTITCEFCSTPYRFTDEELG
ncbi:MAG: Hsp33 family molecular chaperone HslO, partial [Hyphomicrobiaceae bacterium]